MDALGRRILIVKQFSQQKNVFLIISYGLALDPKNICKKERKTAKRWTDELREHAGVT